MEKIANLILKKPKQNCDQMVSSINNSILKFQQTQSNNDIHNQMITMERKRLQFIKQLINEYKQHHNANSNTTKLTKQIYSEFSTLIQNLKNTFPHVYQNIQQDVKSLNQNEQSLVSIVSMLEQNLDKLSKEFNLLTNNDPSWYNCGYIESKLRSPDFAFFENEFAFDSPELKMVYHILCKWLDYWKNSPYYKDMSANKSIQLSFDDSTDYPPILPPINLYFQNKTNEPSSLSSASSLSSKKHLLKRKKTESMKVPMQIYALTLTNSLQDQYHFNIDAGIHYSGFAINETLKMFVPNQPTVFASMIVLKLDLTNQFAQVFLTSTKDKYMFDFTEFPKKFANILQSYLILHNNFCSVLLTFVCNEPDGTIAAHGNALIVEQHKKSIDIWHFEPNGKGDNYCATAPLKNMFQNIKQELTSLYTNVNFDYENATSTLSLHSCTSDKMTDKYNTGFCFNLCVFWLTTVYFIACEGATYIMFNSNNNNVELTFEKFRMSKWISNINHMLCLFFYKETSPNIFQKNKKNAKVMADLIISQTVDYYMRFITSDLVTRDQKEKHLRKLKEIIQNVHEQTTNPKIYSKKRKIFQESPFRKNRNPNYNPSDYSQLNQNIMSQMDEEWNSLNKMYTNFGINCENDSNCVEPLKCVKNTRVDHLNKTCLYPKKQFLYNSCNQSSNCYSNNCSKHTDNKLRCLPSDTSKIIQEKNPYEYNSDSDNFEDEDSGYDSTGNDSESDFDFESDSDDERSISESDDEQSDNYTSISESDNEQSDNNTSISESDDEQSDNEDYDYDKQYSHSFFESKCEETETETDDDDDGDDVDSDEFNKLAAELSDN